MRIKNSREVKIAQTKTYINKNAHASLINLIFYLDIREDVSMLFVNARGAGVSGTLCGSMPGLEGSQSLRRASSIRRTFTAVKRKNICLQVKFTVVSIIIAIILVTKYWVWTLIRCLFKVSQLFIYDTRKPCN